MTPELALYIIMVESDMVINDGTMQSLREAINDGNIYFFDDNGTATGFVTWFLDGGVLEVNNLCIFSKSGITKLFELRKMLHARYPNLLKVRWHNDSRGKEISYGFQQDEQHHRPVSSAKNSSR